MTAERSKLPPGEAGHRAELAAAAYLKHRGYRIITSNYRTTRGEIDIICRDGNCLVFVEVKSAERSGGWFPGERIDARKRERLRLAGLDYISSHEVPAGGIRFDAIIMTGKVQDEWSIEHIPDAFRFNDDP